LTDVRMQRAINQLAERVRHVEGRTQYAVHSGNPNGLVYGIKGTYCIDYENYAIWLNNSEPAGNSWTLQAVGEHDHTSAAEGGLLTISYTRQLLWFVPDNPLTVGTDLSATVVYRGPDITLTRWDIQVKTAPTGASLILDVIRGINSLWFVFPALRPTIIAGATSGTNTGFDIDTLQDGDVLKLDIDQVGSTIAGAQVTLILEGTVEAVVS
jgi:hypothetical protein